ncbi:NAD(P)H-dependent oxidoreductase [Teredinibacter purpureus]|uniref:NAD(P)H-dependent oxidoreductase n=1 Tax=Teredinibacter purpureus TaxID=2731756 RepID=UPI0005F7F068|nr:NAD(P)-dependent oxidoreductase [Teredinibacter purpureus]
MIIVDTAIEKRLAENRPINVALVGAGFSARHIAAQIQNSFPVIHLAIIANRTLSNATKAFKDAGVDTPLTVTTASELSNAIEARQSCITDNVDLIFDADAIEAVIDATGEVEYGARIALKTIQSGKHIFAPNCEMDATVGPLIKHYADKAGVIYSNTDGDEPGVAVNLARHVRTMGLEVVGAGNLKGFYDAHRTPETQKAFAEAHNQKPRAVTSFVDGTKLSMELTVTANALGFGVGKRGMHGIKCDDVRTCLEHYPEGAFQPGKGIVDFLVGASPYTGAYIVGYSEEPMKQEYLRYLKMGDGPLYVFYTPFHLPQLELPITVCRGVLCSDAAVAPKGKPYCDAIAIAKRDLAPGDVLDGLGGFDCYTEIENFDTSRRENLLPMGVSSGCTVIKSVAADTALTYDDVALPSGRFIDELRQEMNTIFFN